MKFGTRGTYTIYMGYLWPFSVEGHLGVIRCTCLKVACNSKMAGHRAKRSEIWDLRVLVE